LRDLFVSHGDSVTATRTISTFWPRWTRLVANTAHSPGLPPAIRARAGHDLERYLRRILFSVGMRRILAGELTDGRLAARILREEFGERARPLLLSVAARACGLGAWPRSALDRAYALARAIRNQARRGGPQLDREYGGYAKWLGSP
jgi:hypothetical protein